MELRAGIVQMVSSSRVDHNLQTVETMMKSAAESNAQLIVLPENFSCMAHTDAARFQVAEIAGHGLIQEFIQSMAKRYGIWIIAGTIPIKATENRMRASCFVYDDKGLEVARYDKIHLFDVTITDNEIHQESASIEPGHDVVVVDTPIGKIGLTVCYDLRFPELYQRLREMGAEIFSIPSAFTYTTGKAHWEILLRARAIENLCYVLAPNQGGEHENGRKTYGHSMIVQPWGNVQTEISSSPDYTSAVIDLEHLRKIRRDFPCNEHHVLASTKTG